MMTDRWLGLPLHGPVRPTCQTLSGIILSQTVMMDTVICTLEALSRHDEGAYATGFRLATVSGYQ
jgi:hypothetical protein